MIRSHLHKAWQAGLSLIELMVGLTIGLFLTLGMFVLITNGARPASQIRDSGDGAGTGSALLPRTP